MGLLGLNRQAGLIPKLARASWVQENLTIHVLTFMLSAEWLAWPARMT